MTEPETRSVVVEREFPFPPERLWRALTQPHLIEEWLMKNDFQPVVGHKFNFRSQPMPGWNGVTDCEVLTVEPNKRLSYSWNGSGDEAVNGLKNRGQLDAHAHARRHACAHGAIGLPRARRALLPGRRLRLAEDGGGAGAGLGAERLKLPAQFKARRKTAPKSKVRKVAKPALLAGGNPQVPKADGDAPVQAYIAAMPSWKRDVGRRLDALIVRTVPGVRKAVKWNSPLYGMEDHVWFLSLHCFTHYVKVAFFRGTSLRPVPPGKSKSKDTRYFHIHEDDQLDESQLVAWVKQASLLPGEKM